jgi:hypothetical protein
MAEWTDESKAKLVEKYVAKNPTPETSSEIVSELADDFDATVNGVRIILSREGVYVKKEAAKSTSKSSGEKKESKADSIARLTAVIEAQGIEADESIISKMTGKAAAYFADTITTALAVE